MECEENSLSITNKSVGILIHKIDVSMKIETLQIFKANKCIVTPEQWGLLYLLTKRGEQYQRQISKALLKDRPNVTRMIDILEKKRLVKRMPDEENRRISKIFLTDKGREIALKYMPLIKKVTSSACEILNEQEIDTLTNILWKIYDHQVQTLKIQI